MRMRVRIPGQPFGKKAVAHDPRSGRAFTDDETRSWMSYAVGMIIDQYEGAPFKGPARINIIAVNRRPQRLNKKMYAPYDRVWCPQKPDWDNIAKA